MTREQLRNIIDDNTTKKGRIFDYTIQVLIFGSLAAYAIETLPGNSPETKAFLKSVETLSAILFSI